MDMYGIIGYPLSHSFSPSYFNQKFTQLGLDDVYHTFPLEHLDQFPQLLKDTPLLKGLNVTIPYKEKIIPYLHELDPLAKKVNAVNCILIENGKLKGYNTDIIGFKSTLFPLLKNLSYKALILGTGGAAKAVAEALDQLGIQYNLVSRFSQKDWITYAEVNDKVIKNNNLIINTTPLGMYPNVGNMPPIPWQAITNQHIVYDLIYNPETTLLLENAKKCGAIVKNGYDMLIAQAEACWHIWNAGHKNKNPD